MTEYWWPFMIKYASLPPLKADCRADTTSWEESPRSFILMRSRVSSTSGLLNFRFTSTFENVLSFFASSKNFGITSLNFSRSWFCKTNCTGKPPLEPAPTAIVCSSTAKILASLKRLSFRCRSLAICDWLLSRRFGATSPNRGCEVFVAPPAGVLAKTKFLSGTESYR
jgi:hypothetical protein